MLKRIETRVGPRAGVLIRNLVISAAGAGLVGSTVLPMAGCEDLPGDPETQGAVAGGAGGAVIGAAVAENSLLGALIGGVLGAGAGYLIGAQVEKVRDKDTEGASEAVREAQTSPATSLEARSAATADINSDGFVTLDEVVAMEEAGFNDQEMLSRLRATGQVFELTAEQERYLRDRGVSQTVIVGMRDINRTERDTLMRSGSVSGSQPVSGPRR
ncbi:MAG TPA: YtxH domain-containing protein [Phycisphaerales bacterium]|nr:YtxH domain-containing protein [Phycisphaerales bacterium]